MEKVISIFGMKLPVKADPSSAWPPDAQEASGEGPARYRYDDSNRLTEVLYPGGSSQVFDYDRHGNLRQRTTANGRSWSYGYDERRRLRSVTGDRGERVTFDYGPGNQRFASAACTTEMDLDQDKRPVRVRQIIDGVTFRTDYDYDAAGHCVAIRPPGSRQWLRYDHDETNQTLRIRADSGHCYVTLRSGEVHFANGVCQRQRLDSDGRLEQIVATASGGGSVMDLCYRFNERWQITEINDRQFAYDSDGRLTECFAGSRDQTRYAHDTSGNRLTEQSATGGTSYLYDERDRLLQMTRPDGSRTDYRYDADGNRIARDDGRRRSEYRYDGEGRLTAVWEDGVCVAEYAYSAHGRRIKKKIGATVTLFHHDENGQLIAETDEYGRAHATYLWAGMRCLGRIQGAVGEAPAEFYHNDHLGSVLAVTAESGDIVSTYDGDVFGRHAGPFFARKMRDEETGFYDFGARFYDPESGRFLTPDSYTDGPDDWRELFDPERDFWGERTPRRHFVPERPQHPRASNPYAFCVNDPVNHIDLDGHNAWWFFLTIPSSLTWALPNTAFALLIVIGNILMEIIGWVVWFVICLIDKEFALKHYPWGNRTPKNPFDPDDRSHLWFGLEASKRLGVPWVLLNGSFFVWRPYTMGNIIFIDDPDDNGLKADALSRYVVPKDPDLQLSAQDALHNHEMQHVFQYACLGSLFHSLPIPPLVRLITGKIEHGELTDRDRWWERIDLGGVTWAVGSLIQLLSFKLIKAKDVQRWVNPATWWSAVLPFKWVELVSNAWNLDNWLPFVGVYEWDSKFFSDQNHSSLERNSGANSGDVYQTVVEAGKTEIRIGEFVRVVGADAVPHATPAGPSVSTVSFGIDPPVNNVGPAAASLNPIALPHRINFNVVNTFPVRVVNASGFYFHSLEAGTFKVKGTGSQTAATETVTIKVSDISVKIETDTFVCQEQDIGVTGDSNAAYTVRVKTSNSGGGIAAGTRTYTAGKTPGTDTVEVVANYDAAKGVFAKYGDNGLAGHDYILRTIDINVKNPEITQDAPDVFVGGIVNFTIKPQPQSGTTTTAVPGSQFNLEKKQFIAGKGPIAADTVETITFDYACQTFPFTVTVKPILATVAPNAVGGGETAQITVAGGTAPFKFAVSEAQSTGPTVNGDGLYTAGSGTGPMTDTITITDRNGEGGRARVQVAVTPMTVAASPAAVGVNGTSTVTALSGVTPFTFSITSRESEGSTINNNGEYRAGTTPGSDTITVSDRKGTRLTVTITVT